MSREKQCDREQVVILTKADFLFATSRFTNSDLKDGKSSMSVISVIKKNLNKTKKQEYFHSNKEIL